MKTLAKGTLSYSVKDRAQSVSYNGVTKTLVVKHEATAGQVAIDFATPTTPTSSAANGFTQPSAGDLAAIDFLTYKANVRIMSSRGIELSIFDDYKVTGQTTIQLLGAYASVGATAGEIFTAYISTVPSSIVLVNEAKVKTRTYSLTVGQTTLNLGDYYTVGKNLVTGQQVGEIRIYRNGALQLRTEDNLSTGEGNYYELGTTGNLSNQIVFLEPPAAHTDSVVVEFGYESAGDVNIVSSLESLYGGFKNLISDVAGVFGWDESRYMSFNPSELDRRAFGDSVNTNTTNIAALSALLSGTRKPTYFRLGRSTDQTGVQPNNTEIKMVFNTVFEDSDNGADTTNGHYVIPAGKGGRWIFYTNAAPLNTNILNGRYNTRIYRNNPANTILGQGMNPVHSAGVAMILPCFTPVQNVSAGDIIEARFFGAQNNVGSPITLQANPEVSFLSGIRIGD